VTGSTPSEGRYQVGLGRGGTDLGWGQNGFQPEFKDSDPNGQNQVRHFAFYLAAGYQARLVVAAAGLYSHEGTVSRANADVALGEVAIQMGHDFTGDYRKLAQDVWHNICGDQSNLNLP